MAYNNNKALIESVIAALNPVQLSGSSDVVGIEIDTHANGGKWGVAQFFAKTGVSTGSPTSYSATFRVTECDASGGSFTDVTDTTIVSAATAAITADASSASIYVDLKGTKRYVKIVALPAFVAGTSPKVFADVTCVLAEPRVI